MFENINFSPGVVTYNPYQLSTDDITDIKFLSQDMFQVEFPKGLVIDVGWYRKIFTLNGVFILCIIKNAKWDQPLMKEEYPSLSELYEGMFIALEKIHSLLNI